MTYKFSELDKISDIFDYYEQFGSFIKIVILLEKCLCNPRMGESPLLEELLHYDLDDEFSHYGEIRDAIDEFVPKVCHTYPKKMKLITVILYLR